MMVTMTPQPPMRASPSSSPSPLRLVRADVPKGVVLDAAAVRGLQREEMSTRKRLAELEVLRRADVEFLVAVGRTTFRMSPTKPTKKDHDRMDLLLFDTPPPPRYVHSVKETRPKVLARRQLPPKAKALFEEETELRKWVECLEAKLLERAADECRTNWLHLTRYTRQEAGEAAARAEFEDGAFAELRLFRKQANIEKPYFNRVPERPRTPTFEESEEIARAALAQAEEDGRVALHDELVLRYGVQLFTVNRVEDIYRQELEEVHAESFSVAVNLALQARYSAPTLVLGALHSGPPAEGKPRPLLEGLALMSGARGSWGGEAPAEEAKAEEEKPAEEEEEEVADEASAAPAEETPAEEAAATEDAAPADEANEATAEETAAAPVEEVATEEAKEEPTAAPAEEEKVEEAAPEEAVAPAEEATD